MLQKLHCHRKISKSIKLHWSVDLTILLPAPLWHFLALKQKLKASFVPRTNAYQLPYKWKLITNLTLSSLLRIRSEDPQWVQRHKQETLKGKLKRGKIRWKTVVTTVATVTNHKYVILKQCIIVPKLAIGESLVCHKCGTDELLVCRCCNRNHVYTWGCGKKHCDLTVVGWWL